MLPVMVADMGAGRRPRQARRIDVLIGQKLEYVRLGPAIVLSFSGGSQVLIETAGHLRSAEGEVEVEPGDYPSDALATLLGDIVRTAGTHDTGDLRLTFDSGAELLVGADPDVESWAVAGPDRFLIVCLARGEVAVWGDTRRRD